MDNIDVIGVGNVCVDTLCVNENYPKEDATSHVINMSYQGGGCVGTALVAVSRLGYKAGYLGNVGDDEVGKRIIQDFKDEEVDIRGIKIIKGGRSSSSIIMINNQNGSRTKFPYKDTLEDIVFDEDKINLIKQAKILHVDGTKYPDGYNAAKIAKDVGTIVSLDACSIRDNNEYNLALVKLTDIFIANARYPMIVSGKDNIEDALKYFKSLGPKIVMATLGNKGVVSLIDNEIKYFPSYKVVAKDTTGAGDTFHGAFMVGYLNGLKLEDNIKYAMATAAIKCEKIGGRDGIPKHDEVIKFLKLNK